MKQVVDKRCVFLIYAGLALAIIIAFEPVRHNGFVNYDDYEYITENPYVKSGINPESVIWAFNTQGKGGNWHPLTWLSHMLDCELFGIRPLWHHLTNLLLHIASTLLLFWLLKKMTGAVWPSAFVAAVFALHPLHVESVAWAAERKDVLSGLFWMLTIAAYIRYVQCKTIGRYLLLFLFLGLGLMAKPMVVTLPFVLLLLDYWPLDRFQCRYQSKDKAFKQPQKASSNYQRTTLYHLIFEKIPLFVLVAASCVVTYIVEQSAVSTESQADVSLNLRVANALVSYVSYLGKMIYPTGLAVLYPHPGDSLPVWQITVSVVILAGISAFTIYMGKRLRYLPAGWLWYLGTLIPVIGLVQVGSQAMADRFTYLPSIGAFIMVAWGAADIFAKWQYRKPVLAITAGAVLCLLLMFTRVQAGYWRNNFVLFQHTLVVTENNYIIHKNYANALYEKGLINEAVAHYNKALKIAPGYLVARLNVGMIFLEQKRFSKAIACFNKVLELEPDHCRAHFGLGAALVEQGRYDDAVKHFNKALRGKLNKPEVYHYLALAYQRLDRYDLAIKNYNEALKINPQYALARMNIGLVFLRQKRFDEAVDCFNKVLQLKPDWPDVYYYLGLVYARQGKYEQAIQSYEEALRLRPVYPDAVEGLEMALKNTGQN